MGQVEAESVTFGLIQHSQTERDPPESGISTGLSTVRLALSEQLGLVMKRVPLVGTITPCGE